MHQTSQAKKLVLVITTFMLVINAKKSQEVILDLITCIYFLVQLWKNKRQLFKP